MRFYESPNGLEYDVLLAPGASIDAAVTNETVPSRRRSTLRIAIRVVVVVAALGIAGFVLAGIFEDLDPEDPFRAVAHSQNDSSWSSGGGFAGDSTQNYLLKCAFLGGLDPSVNLVILATFGLLVFVLFPVVAFLLYTEPFEIMTFVGAALIFAGNYYGLTQERRLVRSGEA